MPCGPRRLELLLGLLADAVEVALALVAERLGLLGRLGADQRRRFLRLGLPPVELGAGFGDQRVVLGGGLGQAALGVAHRLGPGLGRLEGGVGDDPLGGRLGLGADLAGGLASRREHPGGLLAEDLEEHRLVGAVGQTEPRLGSLGPLPELPHLALQPLDEGLDLVEVAPHLLLLVAAAGHLEGAAGDVVAVGGIGHGIPMVGPVRGAWTRTASVVGSGDARSGQQRSRVPPEGVERLQRVLQGTHPDHLDIVADRLPDLVDLGLGHEEHLVAGVAHRDRLLRAAADRADGAVEVHGAGDRHPMPAGELAGGEHVEHREREGQSRRGTADRAGVDGDVDREVGADDAVLGRDADDRSLRVVVGRDRGDLDVDVRCRCRRAARR